MEVCFCHLRVDGRRHAKRQRATIAGSDLRRHLVHEEFILPALGNFEGKLLQVHGSGAAIVQSRPQQERLARGDHCRQDVALAGGKTGRHGPAIGSARAKLQIHPQCQVRGLLKLLLLGAQAGQQVVFLRAG